MTNTNITFEQPLAESKFRYHGIRVLSATAAKVGDILSNSWHPASDCDWVDVDTELDGTCCFEIQGGNVESAIGYVASYWPGEQILALIGSNQVGDATEAGGLPEDGAILLRAPVVLAVVSMCL